MGERDARRCLEEEPAAKPAPRPFPPSDAVEHLTPESLGREAERLANPSRSLFEDADPSLVGVHRGSVLSLAAEVVSGFGVALGVSLVAIVQLLGGSTPDNLSGILAIAGALIAASILGAVVSWRTRTWELTDAGIMLRSGLVTTKQLQVPYEHIHTVNMSSGLVERVLGLMTLDIDTGAARSEGEVTRIKGLQAGMARALREELFRRKTAVLAGACAAEAPAPEVRGEDEGAAPAAGSELVPDARYTLTTGQLVLAALTETRIVAQAAAFLILIIQGINFLQESRLVSLSEAAGDVVLLPASLLIGAVVVFLALALAIGFAVSFVISLIGFAGYRAERAGGRISVERGLLSRMSHTVALERIQSVSVRQGVIRQLMGYAEVRASVVGSIGSSDESSTADGVVLHPFIRVAEVDAFLEAIAPEFAEAVDAVELARLPRAAARRLAFRTIAKVLALAAVLAGMSIAVGHIPLTGESWGMACLALDVLLVAAGVAAVVRMVLNSVLRYRDSRIGHDCARFVMVVGGVRRRTEVVPRTRLQHATASASPFQRRLRIATFVTRTAAMGDLLLRDVSAADTEALLAWVRPRGSVSAACPVDASTSKKD